MADPDMIPQVQPWLEDDEARAAAQAVADNWITEGPRSQEFSDRLNKLIGVPYGVFAPNGTLALALALLAVGIKPGDEIIIPDITFIGSATAAILVGAVPVFVDVERQTFQIDIAKAEAAVTKKTRAVMPVHLYGTACDMDGVASFAKRHGLKVVEDAAQGICVSFKNRHVGGLGDAGCFSFFADKTLTTGEGGYVACNDEDVYTQLRLLRNQGRLDRGSFIHPAIGFNFRMTDMQAAVGLAQFNKLDRIMAAKSQILEWYRQGFDGLGQVRMLSNAPNANHVPFRCVLIAQNAHALMEHLSKSGVQTRGFFYPMHKQPCFADLARQHANRHAFDDANFPNAVFGYENGLCLPIFPTLTHDQVQHITSAIRQYYS
ncbi:MAG: DegT/DnrJ/EryC1/StrS family aminotransferase [Rhodobacteraceae bacterium]|nr:DegT/DnrJ/EryC1/StrS family aminotransferase [Paracoccaceae bacterium]